MTWLPVETIHHIIYAHTVSSKPRAALVNIPLNKPFPATQSLINIPGRQKKNQKTSSMRRLSDVLVPHACFFFWSHLLTIALEQQ